ncbi:MAG TPA: DUF2892 domain-containing protein [Gammaproteobacteria bacterium]|nr:DUF2892 domain-containing protein [Gammaproteobacteria bacterium]
MKPNMGTLDRSIRAVAGIVLIALWPLGLLQGTLAIVAVVVGIVLLVTVLLRWCPPYDLLGINTGARKD